ncbi:hypothetical protein J2045_000925 [Peteryoungia aggregata LMG 23059]|uniref:Uncharacterized protein n=1 Tax=Peteryoungia aggregata LMG 23059 TaxID=1368425 RepID=A0ABU0G3M2_9HYPH|nr:hypothetical protein [Peteryoungia aggregata]MDQ0419912.1 hypothetical protein [Peteryoungia aggregata LMG 23059]
MTPRDYLKEILLPTLEDYEEDFRSRRKGYLACIVMCHLSDYLEKAGASKVQDTMRSLCTAAWNVVHAVAIGAKHMDNLKNPNPIKFTAGSDVFRPPARAGVMVCGWSRLGDADGGMEIYSGEDNLMAEVLPSLHTVLHQYRIQFGDAYLS